jgi:micrococcal nuclease
VARTSILIVASLLVAASCSTRISSDAGGRVFAVVSKVVDGDTVHVTIGGASEEIRLIGVDTPETVHPTKPVQCFGPEASQHTKELLPRGTRVYLVRDVESRDRFGRLLAYVYRASDDLFVNYELVFNGWARPSPFPPNTTLETDFAEAAFHAQSNQLGLWGRC